MIESASGLASGQADCIKTHHNDTDLVRQLRAKKKVVEPLSEFHKDEVRRLGADLGLPSELTQRHPFPGKFMHIIHSMMSWNLIEKKSSTETEYGGWKLLSYI